MEPHLANLDRLLEPLNEETRAIVADALRAWLVALEGQAPDDLQTPS